MQGVGLPDLETITREKKKSSRSRSRSSSPVKKNDKTLDISKISKSAGEASGDTSKTEVLNKSNISKVTQGGIKEDKKDPAAESEEIKRKREAIEKKLKQEATLVRQMLFYLREAEVYTNNPAEVYHIYRDCKEKAAKGLIWHKSDSKVEVIFYRFFRVESVLRRVQILYEWKCKREPRYRHLSIFGFYLQLKQKERILYLVDWPVISSERAVSTADGDDDEIKTEDVIKRIKANMKDDIQRTISLE